MQLPESDKLWHEYGPDGNDPSYGWYRLDNRGVVVAEHRQIAGGGYQWSAAVASPIATWAGVKDDIILALRRHLMPHIHWQPNEQFPSLVVIRNCPMLRLSFHEVLN